MKIEIAIPVLDYALAADLYDTGATDDIILAFVGFGSSKKSNADFITRISAESGQSAVVVDLSGHGDSPFELNETMPAQHLIEVVAAFDAIRQRYPNSRINIIGTSYGGFMAAYLAKFRPVNRLILRTPAIYKPDALYKRHKNIDKLGVREYRGQSDLLKRHPIFSEPGNQSIPTLIIVHGNDESIPIQTIKAYEQSYSAETYTAEGFAHAMRDPSNPIDKLDEYYSTVKSWLKNQI